MDNIDKDFPPPNVTEATYLKREMKRMRKEIAKVKRLTKLRKKFLDTRTEHENALGIRSDNDLRPSYLRRF
jgi:hypothetical protein